MFCKTLANYRLGFLKKLQLAETMNFAEKESCVSFVQFLEGANSLKVVDLQRQLGSYPIQIIRNIDKYQIFQQRRQGIVAEANVNTMTVVVIRLWS